MRQPADSRRLCRTVRLALAALSLQAGLIGGAGKPPNVLFIAADDLRPELGCYGAGYVHSPHLDRLARRGVRFDRAFCQQAICGPSRASLLTGLRPDTLKIEDIDTFFRNTVPSVVTLPQRFREHGYTSVYYGKIFHARQEDNANSWDRRPPGSEIVRRGSGEYQLPASREIVLRRRQDAVEKFGPDQIQGLTSGPALEAADAPDDAYPDGQTTAAALVAMEKLQAAGKPFFLAVGYYKPHLPFVAPKKYFDLYADAEIPLAPARKPPRGGPLLARHSSFELRTRSGIPESGPIDEATAGELRRAYAACTSFVDAQVGRLLGRLDELGLTENTVIVFWGDHGWHLGDLGMWGKATDYEVATRAPLIVAGPGVTAKGRGCNALVEFVDIYPTLCQLAGVAPPKSLEGTSFVPLLSQPDLPWKTAAFSQFPTPALREWAARPLSAGMRQTFFGPLIGAVEAELRQVYGGRYDQALFDHDLMGYSMRTDRHRFTIWIDRRHPEARPYAVELYDHTVDPEETDNIAAVPANAALVEQLHLQWLRGWRGALPPGHG